MYRTARGYDDVEADIGSNGLASAAVDDPGVILLDLGLPDATDLQVIRGAGSTAGRRPWRSRNPRHSRISHICAVRRRPGGIASNSRLGAGLPSPRR
jgi:DNA-binding NarL/FixJ family response regulator